MNASENEPIVPYGAEMSLVPEGYKPSYKVRRLYRTRSQLGTTLDPFHARNVVTGEPLYPRGKYEKHDVKYQCQVVLGSFDGADRTCWLCGFPITHLSNLKNPRTNEYVFNLENTQQDDGTCEHVLPVKLAHGILELLHLDMNQESSKKLVHTEYEFAHNYCNERKGDEYFVTLPLGSTDLCNLQIKESIIKGVLGRIFFKNVGNPGSAKYSGVTTIYKGKREFFPNIVQAYCFTSNPKLFLKSPLNYYLTIWRPRMVNIIKKKMENVIKYIKEADKCDTEERGSYFAGMVPRLEAGLVELKKGTPKSGKTTNTMKTPFKERMQKLQRSSSFSNILGLAPETERVIAFSAPPFNKYVVDKTDKRKISPPQNKTKKNKNNGNGNGRPSPPVVDVANLPPSAVRSERIQALAKELSNDEKKNKSSIGTRKATLLNYGFQARAGEPVVAPVVAPGAGAGEPVVAPIVPIAPIVSNKNTRKANKVPLGRGLFAEKKENGIYISGNTFLSKNILYEMGGAYDRPRKMWKFPLNTNLSDLKIKN